MGIALVVEMGCPPRLALRLPKANIYLFNHDNSPIVLISCLRTTRQIQNPTATPTIRTSAATSRTNRHDSIAVRRYA
jgi:hypothetical protein